MSTGTVDIAIPAYQVFELALLTRLVKRLTLNAKGTKRLSKT
jgi:hypothetical protein